MERREVVNASKEYDDETEWNFTTGRDPLGPPVAYQFPAASSAGDQPATSGNAPKGLPNAMAPTQAKGIQVTANQGVSGTATRQMPAIQHGQQMCLYLGPGGERCYRPALDSGFCPRHQVNASPTAVPDESRARRKKAAATIGIIAALWPLVEELLRQIFRLFR